ncbi:MAG TPA: alpha-amylase family glycosyl hydrolase [Edaphobacter sp.]|nr:alpha-amylase family glycosyl hydrolase [Edaphobacter sp.]
MPTPRRLLTLCLACACLLTSSAPAQTLARPGWVGSGMNTDVWWKHAIVYQVNPLNFNPPTDKDPAASGLHGVAQRLDYIHSLGADALLLTAIQPDAAHAQSIEPAYGTLDDLDDLIHEASRRNIRILLDLDPQIPAADLPNVARFWLNRGIAGFHVIGATPQAHAQAAELRKATNTYLGQRILIGDVDPTLPSSPQQRTYKAPDPQITQLLLDTRLGAVTPLKPAPIRSAIESTENIAQAGHNLALLATDGPSFKRSMSRYADGKNDLAIAKLLATILFTTRAQPLLYYGQELGVSTPQASNATSPEPPKETRADKPKDTSAPTPEAPKDTSTSPVDKPQDTPVPPADKPQDIPVSPADKPQDTPAAAPTDTPKPIPATPIIIWDAPPPPPKGKPAPPPEPSTPNAALEEADPTSLLNWYRRLIELHHSNATLNSGEYLTINRDDQNVLIMIRKPKDVSATNPILVILCNLSGEPQHLSLKTDTTKLHLRGSFLRTLLRSDNAMGTMHLESMTLPPYTAYIGALRF